MPRSLSNASDPWFNLATSGTPPGYEFAQMAYDAADGYTVLFGGDHETASGLEPANSTWAYWSTNATWKNLSLSVAPAASDRWTLAYDPAEGSVIAAGGASPNTWAFHSGHWSIVASNQLPLTANPSVTYDAADGYLLLFGGFRSLTTNETWSYAGGHWTNRTSSVAPPASEFGTLQFDPAIGAAVEYGGLSASYNASNRTYGWTSNGETWTYHAGTWTEQFPAASPGPLGGATAAYIPDGQYLMIFGGTAGTSTEIFSIDNSAATWAYRSGNWFEIPTAPSPSGRAFGGMAFDAVAGEALLFGGFGYPRDPAPSLWTFATPIHVGLAAPAADGVDSGQVENLQPVLIGAVPPVTYSWTALPPGCLLEDAPVLPCEFGAPGPTNLTGSLVDSANVSANFSLPLTISPALQVRLNVSPARTDPGRPVELVATAAGGRGNSTFNLTGVGPPLNCPLATPALGRLVLECTATSSGTSELGVDATDANGNVVAAPEVPLVVALTLHAGISWSPVPPTAGAAWHLVVGVQGGTPPDSFAYGGLPPGCPSANASQFTCTPTDAGTYRVSYWVNDSVGGSFHDLVNLTVAAASVLFGLPLLVVLPATVAAALVAGVAVVFWRRRCKRSGEPRQP